VLREISWMLMPICSTATATLPTLPAVCSAASESASAWPAVRSASDSVSNPHAASRSENVASSLELLIRGRRLRLASVHETREAIEPSCARLAALHRTTGDLRRLEATNEAIAASADLDGFLRANVDWHVAVATASHNEILTGIMMALSRAIYTTTNNEGFINDEVRAITVRAHRSVTRAIKDRDPDAAVRRMSRHVHSYAAAALEVDDRITVAVSEEG